MSPVRPLALIVRGSQSGCRMPDELRIEEGLSPDTIRLLEQMGHMVSVQDAMGSPTRSW
jgi:hypothetical protein